LTKEFDIEDLMTLDEVTNLLRVDIRSFGKVKWTIYFNIIEFISSTFRRRKSFDH